MDHQHPNSVPRKSHVDENCRKRRDYKKGKEKTREKWGKGNMGLLTPKTPRKNIDGEKGGMGMKTGEWGNSRSKVSRSSRVFLLKKGKPKGIKVKREESCEGGPKKEKVQRHKPGIIAQHCQVIFTRKKGGGKRLKKSPEAVEQKR